MSNLRLLGIIIGILGLVITFFNYRGPKWKRSSFILFSLFNICIVAVCVNPELVNFARDVFSFHEFRYGRILALLIVSNIILWLIYFHASSKQDFLRTHMDLMIRNLVTRDLIKENEEDRVIKPVMIVIPAYNEAVNLGTLLPRIPDRIHGLDIGVLVVDDGSDDDTVEVVREHGHLVVSNLINCGQGTANRIGYDILKRYDVAIGVTMDADNQHRPEDIEKMIMPIIDGSCDLVIGSRILGEHDSVSRFRSMGVAVLSRLINLMTGLRITDCSSGFKAFNIKKIGMLDLKEDQFQSSEVLIEACKKGLRIEEVPITIDRREFGHSKKGADWSYGLYFLRTVIKTWWR